MWLAQGGRPGAFTLRTAVVSMGLPLLIALHDTMAVVDDQFTLRACLALPVLGLMFVWWSHARVELDGENMAIIGHFRTRRFHVTVRARTPCLRDLDLNGWLPAVREDLVDARCGMVVDAQQNVA